MKSIYTLLAALAFGMASGLALAQTTADSKSSDKGPKNDCGALKVPAVKAHCEAKQKATEKCQALRGEQKGKCMSDADLKIK